jgi:predicted metalloprotease with PDZ domain
MEHRNSTSISIGGLSLRSAQQREQALSSVAHEFFHVWNVERIRPVGLEPFDFTRENVTCCLWLAEGFTQYYEELLMVRAGFGREPPVEYAVAAINGPGRQVRSPVQMSEHAPFTDDAVANDLTDHSRTFVSYYTYGAAVALALDLALRDLTQNRVTLDDYMRRLWTTYGKAADPRPGYVAKPYSIQDLRRELAELTNNKPFADQFFDKYVEGRDAADYARLLPLAGYQVQLSAAGRGWIGNVSLTESAGGLLVGGQGGSLVPFETPLYEAGVDAGDVIVSIDQRPATMAAYAAIGARRPGDRVNLAIRRRDGNVTTTVVTVKSDPQVQIVPANLSGGALTSAQQAFRRSWLGTKGN